MEKATEKARLKRLYLPPAKKFTLVEVPTMRFMVVDGQGDPGRRTFSQAIKWLFTVAHPIKRAAKEKMKRNFVEPPLECLWWADDIQDLVAGVKKKLKWRLMIVVPDWLTDQMFDDAVSSASKRLGKVPGSLRLERLREGRSVQFMHVGPPQKGRAAIERMFEEFLLENKLVPKGNFHEIYLNDSARVAPERLRTVFRQPVRRR